MTQSIWHAAPETDKWNSETNWSPAGVPGGRATFAASSQTALRFEPADALVVGEIEFAQNAPAYTFVFGSSEVPALTIDGKGVFNHSGKQQSFIVAAASSGYENPQLKFSGGATAGGDDMYYCAGPETEEKSGGGVISFSSHSNAGSASFKAWTGAGRPPKHNSTVGGEISFADTASAHTARFTIYGTLGADGDTFGNVVFHHDSTAASASFTNVGGTVYKGDGGNTQFYDNATAAQGIFNNWGATHEKANGGDVAFDGTSNGGHGHFYNHAAKVADAYGGVTSFNNNEPAQQDATKGASAGNGAYFNYGARDGELGGGGHLEFSAKYGSPTAANANIVNYGSTIEEKSSAGHTIFSTSPPTQYDPIEYTPTAGKATITNHPGPFEGAAAGFTEFTVYVDKKAPRKGAATGNATITNSPASFEETAAGVTESAACGDTNIPRTAPTAGEATCINLGATSAKAAGGYTAFSGSSTAGYATLIAYGGTNGGYGGRIEFSGAASGGSAKVQLFGNGALDICASDKGVTIGSLELTGGVIVTQLGTPVTTLTVSETLTLDSNNVAFSFWKSESPGFEFNTPYIILCGDLSGVEEACFSGNCIDGVEPTFTIVGNELQVTFQQS